MTYDPNIPQPNDDLSISQNDLLINFGQANTQFGNDHYPFNFDGTGVAPYDIAAAGDKGKHKQLTLARVSADIGNAGANELGFYNKNTVAPASVKQEMFMRRESGGTVVQMTAGDPIVAANGATFLPGGLLLQWGTATAGGGGLTLITFPTVFQTLTVPFSITLSIYNNTTGVNQVYIDTGTLPSDINFSVLNTSSNPRTINWMAIGTAP